MDAGAPPDDDGADTNPKAFSVAERTAEDRSVVLGNERILVVDDDPDIVRFVEVNLQANGYEVHVAFDGEEGVRRAIELLPDLVLTGVMMPKLDGFDETRRLRVDPRTRSIPIVILTAKRRPTDIVTGFAAGADDYLTKPFDAVELFARIRGRLIRTEQLRRGTDDASG